MVVVVVVLLVILLVVVLVVVVVVIIAEIVLYSSSISVTAFIISYSINTITATTTSSVPIIATIKYLVFFVLILIVP